MNINAAPAPSSRRASEFILGRLARFAAAHWRVVLLALTTTAVWAGYYDRWTAESWQIPTDYGGDSLEILARIRAAAEGYAVPLRPQWITRLGAPFGANWSAYPTSDLPLLWALGQSVRVIGLFPTANLALLLATVSAAVSFYGCARWLRLKWEWAFAGALLFAFTFQTFHRGLPHLLLMYSWTVPLSVLSSALVAGSRQLRISNGGGLVCLGTAAAIGVGNPYILFLHLQLMGWALVAQWFGARARTNLQVGSAALAIGLGLFFVIEAPVWLFSPDTAAASPLIRNYGGTERYALKAIEMIVPPASHRWEAMAFFGHRYLRWADWRSGEGFAPYLGLFGIAGLVFLVAMSVRAMLRQQRVHRSSLALFWILAFASIGGVTNIIAFFSGLHVFRATNRFSVFVSAIVLLFVVTRLSRWSQRRPQWLSAVAAMLMATIGLADQLPPGPSKERQKIIADKVAADLELGNLLEQFLPEGALVFQLPVLAFPEASPPHHLGDYEHFRPYLSTRTLRFSYGALRGRSRGRWQRDIESLPTRDLVTQLERSGFSAVYFNRRGFADRGEKLLQELKDVGCSRCAQSELGEQVIVFLQPSDNPELPIARTLTYGRGWNTAPPGQPRWAYGPATMSYFNPFSRAVRVNLEFVVSAAGARNLWFGVNGKILQEQVVSEGCSTIRIGALLTPGPNRIDLESTEPAVRLSQERGQLRAFALHNTQVTLEPASLVMDQ